MLPGDYSSSLFQLPLLATMAEAPEANAALVLAGVMLSLVVIYLASKVGGEICARINLPTVLGELVGGVIIGVSALHLLIFPGSGIEASASQIMQILQGTTTLDPAALQVTFNAQSEVISTLSELGVVILLFEIGLESDLKALIQVGIQAAVVAVVGVTVPFVLGTAGLMLLFQVPAIPAIFAGAALTATSIGITAKVLAELQRLSSREGQIIIGAAVLDDVLGIIVLAVVGGLVKTGEVQVTNIVYLVISAAAFLIGGILLGRLVSPALVGLIDRMKTRGSLLLVSLIMAFVLSYVAVAIQLEAILGAFVAGLILAETSKQHELGEQIKPIADMLVPVFFVVVGARTDVSVLNPFNPANQEGLIIATFLVLVAIVGKVVTGLAVFGLPGINRWAIGVGMIPRGEVGLVFAAYGATTGALNPALQAAVIVMVIVTTFIAPPLLRIAFGPDGAAGPEVLVAESSAN
jgi:Kef-type K+ transport system membrane component KefB